MIRQLIFGLCLNEITVTVSIIIVLLFWKKAERVFTIRAWKCLCIVMLIRLLIVIPGFEQVTLFHLDICSTENVIQSLLIVWLIVAILRLMYAGLSYAFLYHKLERYDQTVYELERTIHIPTVILPIFIEEGIIFG